MKLSIVLCPARFGRWRPLLFWLAAVSTATALQSGDSSFEGTIEATLTRGSHSESYTYSVGTNMLRLVRNETDHPYATNLIELDSDRMTLIFPHNRSFMRLKPLSQNTDSPAGFPDMPMPPGGLPSGIGPQPHSFDSYGAPASDTPPAQIGPAGLPSMPAMPADMGEGMTLPEMMSGMPAGMGAGMPVPEIVPRPEGAPEGGLPAEAHRPIRRRSSRKMQFSATGQTTNLLGYACTRYELRQYDRVMEIWATDQLVSFHPWMQNPPHRRYGPQKLEEAWEEFLQARGVFPLWVELKNESGETLPFEFKVVSVTSKHLGAEDGKLFQPPADYHELEPPPF